MIRRTIETVLDILRNWEGLKRQVHLHARDLDVVFGNDGMGQYKTYVLDSAGNSTIGNDGKSFAEDRAIRYRE